MDAQAQQASGQEVQALDTITVSPVGRAVVRPRQGARPAVAPAQQEAQQPAAPQPAGPPQQSAVETLAPVSVITLSNINQVNAKRLSDIFYATPGVSFMDRGDSTSTSINIRGLQDFGRVAVVVDGARQNYQMTGHNANGSFFLDPELVGGVEVVRGPTANIYGSGAIGGVAAFRTKDADDILKPGERFATALTSSVGSNSARYMGSLFAAGRPNQNFDYIFGGTYRSQDDYKGGDGITIGNTSNHVGSALAKVTVRPLDGHEFKFGGLFQEDTYNIGQYRRSPAATDGGTSVYATDVKNYQANARWKYYRPDDNLFNWDANVYWKRTENDQTKIAHTSNTASNTTSCYPNIGNAISGCVGGQRGYGIDTTGFDINNTSRFDAFGFRHAFTIGGDGFWDDVSVYDQTGNNNITTPGGRRSVTGAFAQLKSNYGNWLEIVSAVRYDNYDLSSGGTSTNGDRLSPKITVGVTPFDGFTPYVSYAEGYRAPSLTESLINGSHASATIYDALFLCPSGTPVTVPNNVGNLFCFLPNPNLRPEVGKNKEVGLNLKYDNIFTPKDSFRGKFNVFRNDLEDYIELTMSPPVTVYGLFGPPPAVPIGQYSAFYQYKNIDKAHINGFEAETMYDAGAWFLGLSATYLRGYNGVTGEGLVNIPGNKIVTTGGIRLLDRKMTVGASWVSAQSNQHVPSTYMPSTSYDLVNFFLSYEPVKDLWVNFTVDNALNRYYRPYAIARAASGGSETQNDVLWASVPPGIVYKGTVRVRFGAM